MQLSSPIDLLKQSFKIFFEKKNLAYFLKVYSPLLPFAIIFAAGQYLIKNNFSMPLWATGALEIVSLISVLVSFFVSLAEIYAVVYVVSGNGLSVRSTYEAAWKRLWKFSLLSILLFLIIVGGLVLFVIPGMIFGIWFSFSRYVFVEKNAGIKQSLSESKALVKGRVWRVFGKMLVFELLLGIPAIVIGIIPYGVGTIITTMAGALFVLPFFLLYKELGVNG